MCTVCVYVCVFCAMKSWPLCLSDFLVCRGWFTAQIILISFLFFSSPTSSIHILFLIPHFPSPLYLLHSSISFTPLCPSSLLSALFYLPLPLHHSFHPSITSIFSTPLSPSPPSPPSPLFTPPLYLFCLLF